tara:strand:- start:3718 stop:3861 length:144 start_codon:yes stop_codon:yes gene_type:complete
MANEKDGKAICPDCNGNGFIYNQIYSEFEDDVSQCETCNSQGEIEKE